MHTTGAPFRGMASATHFLGVQLLADALADGLADDGTRLDCSLAAYQSAFREKTADLRIYVHDWMAANVNR